MTLVTNLNMRHGLAVIGRKQTAGVGRNKNQVGVKCTVHCVQCTRIQQLDKIVVH